MFRLFAGAAGYCRLDMEFSARIVDQGDDIIVSNNQISLGRSRFLTFALKICKKKRIKSTRPIDQGGETTLEFSCPEGPTTAHAQRSQSTAKLWLFLRMLRLPDLFFFLLPFIFFSFQFHLQNERAYPPHHPGYDPLPRDDSSPHLNWPC